MFQLLFLYILEILFQAKRLFTDDFKGMLNSAALVDINGDNIKDIIIATFNSTVIALDGSNYKMLWNVTFINSESYSHIAIGYYDEDDIPDFLVKYQYGKGRFISKPSKKYDFIFFNHLKNGRFALILL